MANLPDNLPPNVEAIAHSYCLTLLSVRLKLKVMKDGRATESGKYNDILSSGSDFMELVGAHREAISAIDTAVAGSVAETLIIDLRKKKETRDSQNGNIDDDAGLKGQLVRDEERVQGRVAFQSTGSMCNNSIWRSFCSLHIAGTYFISGSSDRKQLLDSLGYSRVKGYDTSS